jgi:hypothetical protein
MKTPLILLAFGIIATSFAFAGPKRHHPDDSPRRVETTYVDAAGRTHIITTIIWDDGNQTIDRDDIISESN